jgi:hypothetical protein
MLPEEQHRLEEEVVEVEGVVLGEQRLVALVGAGDHLLEVAPDALGVVLRGRQLALGAGDDGEEGPRLVALLVELEVDEGPLHEGELVGVVVDGEAARHADPFAVAAQDAGADGVEGAEGYGARPLPHQAVDAVAHLAGGLVGERHRHDAMGADAAADDQVGDAVRDDPGLAAPRSGEDEERAFRYLNGLALGRVQAFEDVHGIAPASFGMEDSTFAGGRLILASALGCFNAGVVAAFLET